MAPTDSGFRSIDLKAGMKTTKSFLSLVKASHQFLLSSHPSGLESLICLRFSTIFSNMSFFNKMSSEQNSKNMKQDSAIMLDKAKRTAAYKAVDIHVKSGQVVGVGSGSTVVFVIERLAERVEKENLNLICIPTSLETQELLQRHNLPLSDLNTSFPVDVTIDGCDDCDNDLNLIKGGGGCLLQEKLVAGASKKLVIVADYRKNSSYLGQSYEQGIPLECSQMGWKVVIHKLSHLTLPDGSKGSASLRLARDTEEPFVTDNGNYIIDFKIMAGFKPSKAAEVANFEKLLKTIPGILETGLFINMATRIYFGMANGSIQTKNVERDTIWDDNKGKV